MQKFEPTLRRRMNNMQSKQIRVALEIFLNQEIGSGFIRGRKGFLLKENPSWNQEEMGLFKF